MSDLWCRTVSYTDVSASVTANTYDADGKVTIVTVDGQQMANVTYDAVQRLQKIVYPDGSALNSIGRDPAQRVVMQEWLVAGQVVSDNVLRSQSGRVVKHISTMGATTYSSTYGYDTAGRLVSAAIPGHELTYAFASSGGCGPNTVAGMSGNRTGSTDVWTAPGQSAVTTTSSYCYDWADRLLSSSVTGAVSGATSVADGVAAAEITYDVRGNTTRLADMQFAYDAANRHVGTTYDDGTTVQIVRDASGRIVARTVDPAGAAPAVTTKYLYGAGGDAAWGQKTGSDLTRSIGLPGGVSWTNQAGVVTWSFPNLNGHGLVTRSGSTTGALLAWDPFGQPVDPVTFAIGTAASDDKGQIAGNTAWHQGALKPAESAGSTLVVEMGARLYVPALGRFLQVDPIEGGGTNDYVWPPDPINGHDLSGNIAIAIPLFAILVALLLIAAYISMPRPVLPPIAINFRWPTIKAPTVVAKPLVIPVPRPTNYRIDKKYMVYEIVQKSTNDTWKYGITSGSPLERRPQSQLAACAAHFGSPCDWRRRATNLQGYYQARLVEYSYIVEYARVHGSCPPGQPSCK